MTDSGAPPFSLRDLCSGLYDVLDRADMYQDGDSLVECAFGRRTSFDFCRDSPGVAPQSSNKTKYCGTEAGLVKSWAQARATAPRAC